MPDPEQPQSRVRPSVCDGPIRVGPNACLELLGSGGVWLPAVRTVFVADVHLGKATAFAVSGLPLSPEVGLRAATADLKRLTELLSATAAQRLVILGDFLHARASRQPELFGLIAAWREAHQGVGISLVIGNHDRQVGPLPAAWSIDAIAEGGVDVPARAAGIDLVLCHEPTTDPRGYVLCGHVHPVATVTAPASGSCLRERLPIVVVGGQRLILPAFGSFTGGVTPDLLPDDRLFALGGGRAVVELPRVAVGRRTAVRR